MVGYSKRQILSRSLSIALAVAPFGLTFGVACKEAGLGLGEAVGFSSLVFTGSAQFAAVSVLDDGGTIAAAVVAGLLLNIRSLAFGVAMAPDLRGPVWWRALVSQLMIDESVAVGTAQVEPRARRYGYIVAGLLVFALWNASTIVGVLVVGSGSTFVATYGLDATIPAAFIALLWPRLRDNSQLRVALGGAAIGLLLTPFLPAGLPIVLATLAIALGWRKDSDAHDLAGEK